MSSKLHLILGAAALLAATPLLAQPRGDEPVAVPSSIKQGVDFVYVDPQMSSVARRQPAAAQLAAAHLRRLRARTAASAPNPVFLAARRGPRAVPGDLGRLAAGRGLRPARRSSAAPTGRRVDALRTRLGLRGRRRLRRGARTSAWRSTSASTASTADGIAGRATIASLNLGAEHYERRIAINMERAWRLPATNAFDRYVLVDSGAAEAYLFDRDRVADSMRVIVGTAKTKTPMMAVLMRNAKANPYWNVPPELIRSLTAKRDPASRASPTSSKFHYEVLADWSADGRADRSQDDQLAGDRLGPEQPTIRVRQLPGPWNSMGEMKFEMPNDYGIYLHDTPTQGAVRAGRPLAQQRLRAARGLSPLRHLGVRPRAAGELDRSSR